MNLNRLRGARLLAWVWVIALLTAIPCFVEPLSVAAQVSGIQRGGGVDRPFVTVRKRLATKVVARPQPKPPKGVPEPTGAAMTISADAKKHYDAGRAAYDKNDFDAAIREFEAAIRVESRFVDAIIDLGDAYFDNASVEEAVDAYQRALVVDRGNLDAQFRLGRASYARRDYDTALKSYNDVLKSKPNDPEAIYNIALTNKALKRYDAAIPFFEKSIAAREKPFPEARINLSRCYYELGKLPEAEAAARKAIDEIGADLEESANAHYALATALASKPDLPAATEAIQKAIAVCQKCPSDMVSRFYLPLAKVQESRGNRTQAADAYERFLQLAPFLPDYQIQEYREKIAKLRAAR